MMNDSQKKVLDFLSGGPASIREIKDGTETSETTVRKVIKELQKASLVRKLDDRTPVHFESTGPVPQPAPTKGSQGREEVAARDAAVLKAVRSADPEGTSKKELALATGLSENLVYISLWRLGKNGDVKATARGRTATYVPAR